MTDTALFDALRAWVDAAAIVDAAVLYGSAAHQSDAGVPDRDGWPDFDLHVIAGRSRHFDSVDWNRALPGQGFCLAAKRVATGGTKKLTLLFASGQVDMVLLSTAEMRCARWAMHVGLHRKLGFIRHALNEMATSMRPGYRFLKGAKQWGPLYARVVREMPGVRVSDDAARRLADEFLVHMLLALTRLERGELLAAQFGLHSVLCQTNLRLMRELRLRRELPLPSFGLGRRTEALVTPEELDWVRVDAALDKAALAHAIWKALDGLKALMNELEPRWRVPASVEGLLLRYGGLAC